MAKVLADKVLIEKFLTRGVEKVYPNTDALRKKLMSGDRIRVYQGFDPTGPYLHVGHAMGIRALRILQKLGHKVIFLIGDYTAKVGDPDKDTTRKMLTDEEIEKNRQGWKEQAAQLINFEGDNPVLFKRNYDWLSKLTLADIIKLMSHVTMQQMMERDLFANRLKQQNPIALQEFIYPLMQGYDGVAMEVDMEIGGSDQTFNMLIGRQLSKAYLNKEKFVRTNKMMDAPDGLTMSKTRGNGINLSDTPEDMYGKAMSYQDELITKGLELLTDLPMQDISDIRKEMEAGANPMQFKKLMSFETVKTIKGEKAAKDAQDHFEKTVQKGEKPDDMIETVFPKSVTSLATVQAFVKDTSSSEIKRIIQQGGFEVNNIKITDPNKILENKSGDIIKFGKRRFVKVK